jgi:hypothetical protein
MKKGTIAAAAIMASLTLGHTAFAQDETSAPQTQEQQDSQKFTDSDLEKFIEVNSTVTELEKEGRQAMIAAIKEANLTVARFNELAQAHRKNKLEETAESKDEVSAFGTAARNLAKVQPETKKKIEEAVQEADLTMEMYETIMAAFQKDPAVEMRIKKILSDK